MFAQTLNALTNTTGSHASTRNHAHANHSMLKLPEQPLAPRSRHTDIEKPCCELQQTLQKAENNQSPKAGLERTTITIRPSLNMEFLPNLALGLGEARKNEISPSRSSPRTFP